MFADKTELKKYKPWIMNRADPYVYKHVDGTYFFTASVPEYDRIILRRSETLAGLADAEEHIIWEKHESGVMSAHIWAPEIHCIEDRWYIYFAAGEKEDIWNIRPFVLECKGDPVAGKWEERGKIQRAADDMYSFGSFSLDATTFDVNGRRYLVWAEKPGRSDQVSNLYIAEMESPVKLKSAQVMLTSPDYDWERVEYWVNEGPAALIKNGKVYLTYSASATGSCYCVGMLTADQDADLLDPRSWKKSRYPIMKSDPDRGVFGPGHNSFTVSEDGKDIMVFHARQ